MVWTLYYIVFLWLSWKWVSFLVAFNLIYHPSFQFCEILSFSPHYKSSFLWLTLYFPFPNIMLLFPISVYSCLLFVLKASVMVIFGFSLIFFSPLVTCLGFLWLSHLCWLHKPVSVSNPYLVLSVQFDPVLFGQRHRFL